MKLNINFPNGVSISIEVSSEESSVILGSVLSALKIWPNSGFRISDVDEGCGIAPAPAPIDFGQERQPVTELACEKESNLDKGIFSSGRYISCNSESEDDFVQFCHSVNPLGDMRKVVVVVDAAERLLNLKGIDSEELGLLFDLIGWSHPHDFGQTLRNAARSKFRWLERMPGRTGRYGITQIGRSVLE